MCLAIPGQILELIPGPPLLALVDVTGVRRKVDLGLLVDENPLPGDWVLIHVGFAMSKISERGAHEQMQMLTHAREKTKRPWTKSAAMAKEFQGDRHEICGRVSRTRCHRANGGRNPSHRRSAPPLSFDGSLRRPHACHLPFRP